MIFAVVVTMFLLVFLLISCTGGVLSFPEKQTKIVGGWTTTISQYPHVASLLYSYFGANHRQTCGGTILNTRSILTAAHCVRGDSILRWRVRTGSTYANSGGTVYNVGAIIAHSFYNVSSNDNDVAILRSLSTILYNSLVQPATIAGASYYLADHQPVWAVGWGSTASGGSASENLLQVQIWSVNQIICKNRYLEVKRAVTDNMLCSGWLDVGGRDQCQGDSGGPLYHNGIVVGVCSWGLSCAMPRYPGVNARVSRYTAWIQSNA